VYTREWKPARSAGVSENKQRAGGQNGKSGLRVFTTTPWQEEPRHQEKICATAPRGEILITFCDSIVDTILLILDAGLNHANLFDDANIGGLHPRQSSQCGFINISLPPGNTVPELVHRMVPFRFGRKVGGLAWSGQLGSHVSRPRGRKSSWCWYRLTSILPCSNHGHSPLMVCPGLIHGLGRCSQCCSVPGPKTQDWRAAGEAQARAQTCKFPIACEMGCFTASRKQAMLADDNSSIPSS